jgi:hypothetical protein
VHARRRSITEVTAPQPGAEVQIRVTGGGTGRFFHTIGLQYEYKTQGFDLNGAWYLPDFGFRNLASG